ncbi:unnamed protein product, partial [Amoebophrya sp. A120]
HSPAADYGGAGGFSPTTERERAANRCGSSFYAQELHDADKPFGTYTSGTINVTVAPPPLEAAVANNLSAGEDAWNRHEGLTNIVSKPVLQADVVDDQKQNTSRKDQVLLTSRGTTTTTARANHQSVSTSVPNGDAAACEERHGDERTPPADARESIEESDLSLPLQPARHAGSAVSPQPGRSASWVSNYTEAEDYYRHGMWYGDEPPSTQRVVTRSPRGMAEFSPTRSSDDDPDGGAYGTAYSPRQPHGYDDFYSYPPSTARFEEDNTYYGNTRNHASASSHAFHADCGAHISRDSRTSAMGSVSWSRESRNVMPRVAIKVRGGANCGLTCDHFNFFEMEEEGDLFGDFKDEKIWKRRRQETAQMMAPAGGRALRVAGEELRQEWSTAGSRSAGRQGRSGSRASSGQHSRERTSRPRASTDKAAQEQTGGRIDGCSGVALSGKDHTWGAGPSSREQNGRKAKGTEDEIAGDENLVPSATENYTSVRKVEAADSTGRAGTRSPHVASDGARAEGRTRDRKVAPPKDESSSASSSQRSKRTTTPTDADGIEATRTLPISAETSDAGLLDVQAVTGADHHRPAEQTATQPGGFLLKDYDPARGDEEPLEIFVEQQSPKPVELPVQPRPKGILKNCDEAEVRRHVEPDRFFHDQNSSSGSQITSNEWSMKNLLAGEVTGEKNDASSEKENTRTTGGSQANNRSSSGIKTSSPREQVPRGANRNGNQDEVANGTSQIQDSVLKPNSARTGPGKNRTSDGHQTAAGETASRRASPAGSSRTSSEADSVVAAKNRLRTGARILRARSSSARNRKKNSSIKTA